MKHLTYLLLSLFVIVLASSVVTAQPIGRTFGGRRLILDNNDLVLTNNVYFIDVKGSLGIDNTGFVNGTYPNTSALMTLLAGAKTTNLRIDGGATWGIDVTNTNNSVRTSGKSIFGDNIGVDDAIFNAGNGKLTINCTSTDYAAKINTSSLLGLEVHCTAQSGTGLDNNTHFVDFYDGSKPNPRGSIQGQNLSNLQSDPIFQANAAIFAANTVLSAALAVAGPAAVSAGATPPGTAAPLAAITGGIFVAQVAQLAIAATQYGLTVASLENNLGVSYQSSAGDYAEYLKRANPDEKLYPGDIVGVKNGLISKNTEGAQSIFSISLAPIVLGNFPPEGHEAEYNKVGFLGQVPVKVSGVVHEGDFVIASGLNDGIGVAVSPEKITPDQFTMVVGRSWETSNYISPKYIKVAVGLNAKAMSEIMSREQKEIELLKSEVNELHKSNSIVSSKLDRIEKYLSQPVQSTKEVMLRSN